MDLDPITVLDEAIKVANELPAVKSWFSYYEDEDGKPTRDVTEARSVCVAGAARVAIYRLTGETDADTLHDVESEVFGWPLVFETGAQAAVENDSVADLLAAISQRYA